MGPSEVVQQRAVRRPPFDFAGRRALVTGAGRGIGRATAALLSQCGCVVGVNDRDEAGSAATVESIVAAGGQAVALPGDVGEPSSVRRIVAAALEHLGGVDFLVNNAGISRYKPITECSDADWDEHVDVMAKGTFLMIREVGPLMTAAGFGRIVNLGS